MYRLLSAWRLRRSNEENIAPYIIAHNSTLKDIVKLRPIAPLELMTIKGFGERRVNKYGKEIIAVLNGEMKI
jgi:ATP-dependent DNA helicase RecQ